MQSEKRTYKSRQENGVGKKTSQLPFHISARVNDSYNTLQTLKHENTLKILEFINIYRLRDGPVMVIFRVKNV